MEGSFRLFCKAAVVTLVAAVAYAMGYVSASWLPKKAPINELAEAVPPEGLVLSATKSCGEPTDEEKAIVKAAVDILAFPANEAGFLAIGAERFLSRPLYRMSGNRSHVVCDSPELFERAGQLINKSEHLRNGRLVEYGFNLIARLPHPNESLIKVVAGSAFSDAPQASDLFPARDLRPLARATLAGFGLGARPYADRAFAQISIADAMGTGAAQVAVAGNHLQALETVERLMNETLAKLPRDRAVPHDTRDRLYEMAYALSFGGEDAKQHIAPLRNLMARKIQSWAPPFGMVDLHPRRMCQVLANITGRPTSDLEFKYCTDENVPYEQ